MYYHSDPQQFLKFPSLGQFSLFICLFNYSLIGFIHSLYLLSGGNSQNSIFIRKFHRTRLPLNA